MVGLLAGRAFFPLEVPKAFVVEKEKRVEVPVDRIVIQKEPFEVIRYVDRVVEKPVEVPVERVIYRDRAVENLVTSAPAGLSSWRRLKKGISRDEVRTCLGEPLKIKGGDFERWYYGQTASPYGPATVTFYLGLLDSWVEP